MNVIISNKADDVLSSLNIDVIKKIQGEFSADEIVSMFENFFYEKMILDITAIKDYDDFKNIQSLAMNLDADKLIILLSQLLRIFSYWVLLPQIHVLDSLDERLDT